MLELKDSICSFLKHGIELRYQQIYVSPYFRKKVQKMIYTVINEKTGKHLTFHTPEEASEEFINAVKNNYVK